MMRRHKFLGGVLIACWIPTASWAVAENFIRLGGANMEDGFGTSMTRVEVAGTGQSILLARFLNGASCGLFHITIPDNYDAGRPEMDLILWGYADQTGGTIEFTTKMGCVGVGENYHTVSLSSGGSVLTWVGPAIINRVEYIAGRTDTVLTETGCTATEHAMVEICRTAGGTNTGTFYLIGAEFQFPCGASDSCNTP